MKQLNEQQIQDNWIELRGIINDTFSGERLDKLNKMYDYFEDRMVMAPASGRAHFHNAMVGGYVEHILHVVKFHKSQIGIEKIVVRYSHTIQNYNI
jgi:hypothetical protein